MAEVTFEHLTKKYDAHTTAVDDLNLEIGDTEFLVLVGPSGCGKTTTLRLLAGLEDITSGEIRIGDRVVNNVPAKDRDLAMVFQTYALYPHMTVYDNMAFGLSLRHIPKDEIGRRVERAAETLGISDLLKRKPRQLSGGQRQRVALGRAIVRNPAVFLLDEPLSNLDAKLRLQTRAELTKLHDRLNGTFIYVTHDQVEAMTMATRLAVMEKGKLQQVGTPLEVYGRPVNMFVAGFIGSPGINFVEMDVKREGESVYLQREGIRFMATAEMLGRLKSAGEKVVMGIRPEHISRWDNRPPGNVVELKVRADVVELLGNETIVYLIAPGDLQLVARLEGSQRITTGDAVTAGIDLNEAHLFDPETGLALRA